MLKESGLINDIKTVEYIKKDMVAKEDPKVKGELSRILVEYVDIFLEKLSYGPPPRRVVDHEIEVVRGSTPPHKTHIGLVMRRWRSCGRGWTHRLTMAVSGLVQALMACLLSLYQRKVGNGACA